MDFLKIGSTSDGKRRFHSVTRIHVNFVESHFCLLHATTLLNTEAMRSWRKAVNYARGKQSDAFVPLLVCSSDRKHIPLRERGVQKQRGKNKPPYSPASGFARFFLRKSRVFNTCTLYHEFRSIEVNRGFFCARSEPLPEDVI